MRFRVKGFGLVGVQGLGVWGVRGFGQYGWGLSVLNLTGLMELAAGLQAIELSIPCTRNFLKCRSFLEAVVSSGRGSRGGVGEPEHAEHAPLFQVLLRRAGSVALGSGLHERSFTTQGRYLQYADSSD